MQGIFKWGGIAASVILIAFGIGSIGAGIFGSTTPEISSSSSRSTGHARHDAECDQDRGSAGWADERRLADLQRRRREGATRARKPSASRATCVIHTLEATGGQDVRGDGPYLDKNGKQTVGLRPRRRTIRRTGGRFEQARDVWVTYTALSDRAQHVVFRRDRGRVRDRDGHRPAARRDRIPDARPGVDRAEPAT